MATKREGDQPSCVDSVCQIPGRSHACYRSYVHCSLNPGGSTGRAGQAPFTGHGVQGGEETLQDHMDVRIKPRPLDSQPSPMVFLGFWSSQLRVHSGPGGKAGPPLWKKSPWGRKELPFPLQVWLQGRTGSGIPAPTGFRERHSWEPESSCSFRTFCVAPRNLSQAGRKAAGHVLGIPPRGLCLAPAWSAAAAPGQLPHHRSVWVCGRLPRPQPGLSHSVSQ